MLSIYFEARGVEGVGMGYLIVHRPDPDSDGAPRAPWRVLEEVATRPAGPLGEHVARCLEVRSGLAVMDNDAVAGLRPITAPDVTEERHLRPGAGEPDVILIRQGGGFGRVVEADTALAALVGMTDGELSVVNLLNRSSEVIFMFIGTKAEEVGSWGWIMSPQAKAWNCFAAADDLTEYISH